MILKLFLLTGLMISCAQGRDCTEKSKPHQTRCDTYFKCVVLPSKNLAWIPTKCNRGLIYDKNMRICVLPDVNWECTLGDESESTKADDHNVYGISNLDYLNKEIKSYRPKYDENGNKISSESDKSDLNLQYDSDSDGEEKIVVVSDDGSDIDENNIEIVDDYTPITENETSDANSKDTSDDDVDYSGDGSSDVYKNDDIVEKKETYIAIPVNSDPNSSVASHLQRLSQLIQSLKDSQLNKSQTYDLGPNELNNFLAHHNIKVEYNDHLKNQKKQHEIPLDGRIHPDHLSEILDLQQKLQSMQDSYPTTTPYPSNSNKFPVATKIQIKSPSPLKNIRITDPGYSSSQIVVNRPEGTVLFSLPSNTPSPPQSQYPSQSQYPLQPQYSPQSQYSSQSQYSPQSKYQPQSDYPTQFQYPSSQPSDPYISSDTLKTVLELSKQMISSSKHQQAIQNYIPEQNYLQPIFRPIYYNIPIHDLPIPIINNYEKKEPKHEDSKDQDEPHYEKISSVTGFVDSTPKYQPENDDQKPDEHATIIHNHIPITIESPFQQQNQKSSNSKPTAPPVQITTAAGVESAGTQNDDFKPQTYSDSNNNIPPNYQQYAAVSEGGHNPFASYFQEQQLPQSHQSYSSIFEYSQPNSGYYQHQPQPYQQQFFQNPQGPVNGFPPSFYTQQAHLNDNNVNNFVKFNTPQYPTLRPAALSSLTATDQMYNYPNQVHIPTSKYDPINTVHDLTSFDENSDQQFNDDADTDNTQTNDEENVDDYDNGDYDANDEDSIAADINKSNVMSLLADLENKKFPLQNKQLPERAPVNPLLINANNDSKRKVVQFGDNFLSIDEYEKLVQPLLERDAASKLEIIPCVTGARQPYGKDCTKYLVCNGNTNKVLTYSCPPYTAFNQQTRFCDAKTFGICKKGEINSDKESSILDQIDANKRLQIKADKELQQAQRDREQAIKTQQLTALIKQQTQNILNSHLSNPPRPMRNRRKKIKLATSSPRPYYRTRPSNKRKKNRPRLRRIPCREPSKVADKLSVFNYFTCYKGSDGTLKARKMTCPSGLIFCERIRLCTSTARCSV